MLRALVALSFPLLVASCVGGDPSAGPAPNEELSFPRVVDIDNAEVDLRPAELGGDFGPVAIQETEPATVATLHGSDDGASLYFDRTATDGRWTMIQLTHPGAPSELLPTPDHPTTDLLDNPETSDDVDAVVCTRVDGYLDDQRAERAELVWVGQSGAVQSYELRMEGRFFSVRARFQL